MFKPVRFLRQDYPGWQPTPKEQTRNDGRPAQYKPPMRSDFVIIGSGAAGGILAKGTLEQNGFRVVVLEQGPI